MSAERAPDGGWRADDLATDWPSLEHLGWECHKFLRRHRGLATVDGELVCVHLDGAILNELTLAGTDVAVAADAVAAAISDGRPIRAFAGGSTSRGMFVASRESGRVVLRRLSRPAEARYPTASRWVTDLIPRLHPEWPAWQYRPWPGAAV